MERYVKEQVQHRILKTHDPIVTHEGRLESVDFFRGLALLIVLVDHIDWWARAEGGGFIRDWMPIGLGFSDAAEAFVFLSGFTFGWVYTQRMAEDGFLPVAVRALIRAVEVYGTYLATVAVVALLAYAANSTFADLGVEDEVALCRAFFAAMRLEYQPFALGVLCFYVVIIPCLPILLALIQRLPAVAICLSLALYGFAQFEPTFSFAARDRHQWIFNPLAWQALATLGLAFGRHARLKRAGPPRAGLWTVAAVLFVAFGVLTKKGLLPAVSDDPMLSECLITSFVHKSTWVGKMQLGLVRIVHFLAVTHLATLLLPRGGPVWLRSLMTLFVVCGRSPLVVYSTGTVLAYFSAIIFHWVGTDAATVSLVALDACFVEFAIARLFNNTRLNVRKPKARDQTKR